MSCPERAHLPRSPPSSLGILLVILILILLRSGDREQDYEQDYEQEESHPLRGPPAAKRNCLPLAFA